MQLETCVVIKGKEHARINLIDLLAWEAKGWKRDAKPNAPPSAPEPIEEDEPPARPASKK